MVGTPRASARSPCIICPPDPSGHGHSHGSSNISVVSTVTQSSGSRATLTKSQKSQYYYVEDYFEKSPKTDYTYARSGTYSKDYLDADYVMPNLSRLPLRSLANRSTVDIEMARKSSNENSLLRSSNLSESINRRVTRSGSKAVRGSLAVADSRRLKKDAMTSTVRVLDYEEDVEDEDISSYSAASQSQSQRMSNSHSQSQSQGRSRRTSSNYSSSNQTHSNNVSNRSSRSSAINHLYGLDHTDTEMSENESIFTQTMTASSASGSSLSSIASYVQSSVVYTFLHSVIYSYIVSTIAWLFSQCWWFICAPFYLLISKVCVLDVWLLSRATDYRRRRGLLLLLLLFLLPFLLLGLMSAYRNNALYIPFLFGGREKTIVVQQEDGNVISGVALEQKVRQIFGNLNIYQNLREEINQIIIQQKSPEQVAAGLSKEEVEVIARGILEERWAAHHAAVEKQRQKDVAAAGLHDESSSEEMRLIREQLLVMQQKTTALEKEVGIATAKLNAQQIGATDDKKQYAAYIADLQNQIGGLRAAFARIEETQLVFAAQMKNCCQNATQLGLMIQEKVAAALAMLMSTDANGGPSGGFGAGLSGSKDRKNGGGPGLGIISFGDWLKNHFVSKDDMNANLAFVAAKVTRDIIDKTAESSSTGTQQAEEDQIERQGDTSIFITNNKTTLTEAQVQVIVQQALSIFMADKTGMVDYALESAGGCVLNIRCSEDYKSGTGQYMIFGIPIFYVSNSPRAVIQPDVNPGNCWAFKGHTGYVVIQLSQTIIPTSFSLEHIPKSLSPTGNIDSAPKEFSVWGLQSEHDRDGQPLGNFTYDKNGPPIQFFNIKPHHVIVKPMPIVELMIHSNHGNKDYTCLYRFRVHGKIHFS